MYTSQLVSYVHNIYIYIYIQLHLCSKLHTIHVLYRMLATWMTQAESSLLENACESIYSRHSLTSLQMQECKKYPRLVIPLVTIVIAIFQKQCYHQFRHEKWNCQGIIPPIFGVTQPFSTLRKGSYSYIANYDKISIQ